MPQQGRGNSVLQIFMKQKILVILGSTATGKSDLAVKLAKWLNGPARNATHSVAGGEVISADSRQVYKGLDIGTGKITKKEMLGVPHHMLDIISPRKVFSVAEWKKRTEKLIEDIISRKKIPIICGGTGFYIQSIVDNLVLPEVPPNPRLRKKLEKKTVSELFSILKKLDSKRAKSIDKENPVRLIRAIEIARTLGKVPALKKKKSSYEFLQIGMKLPDKDLKNRIHKRLLYRIKKGMIEEAKRLHRSRLSWKRMRELGLEYRYLAELLQKKITKAELITKLETEIWHYAKRQMTWFKRPARNATPARNAVSTASWHSVAGGDKRIKWFEPAETTKIKREVVKFLEI